MYITSETMVDLIKLTILVAFFVGTFLIFSTFNIIIQPQNEDRKVLDLLNAFLNDKCVLYQDGKNYYRGIIDIKKLREEGSCLDLIGYYFKVSDPGDSWESGLIAKNSFSLPAVIYHEDTGEFRFGKVEVQYEKGSTSS